MQIQIFPYRLVFKRPATTSRNTLLYKDTFFVKISNEKGQSGWGEINLFKGLSADDRDDFMPALQQLSSKTDAFVSQFHQELQTFPSIRFGIETALQDLVHPELFMLFPSAFTQKEKPIPINGLVWMGDKAFMSTQIRQKLEAGFRCVKMKIGALDFETEYAMLKSIRDQFSHHDIELRVDANGAFSNKEALYKLNRLSKLHLHSIEQPIRQGQWEDMRQLCRQTPLPIALDEELIGIYTATQKQELLSFIQPQYIILKPALTGGWQASEEWIKAAEKWHIGWWITSALESNIGLNAIAQWTAQLDTKDLFQGLGTGGLYTNNIASPLTIEKDGLVYKQDKMWKLTSLALKSIYGKSSTDKA